MSRSNRVDAVNPANRFFKWKGGDGELVYFDKALGEHGEEVKVEMPFRFMVLDVLAGAAGGNTVNGQYQSYWSNAVRNTKKQQLIVRSKGGTVARGYYEDIKGKDGIKFQQLVYIAFREGDGPLQIGCLKLTGAALGAWFDFQKVQKDIYAGAISIDGKGEKEKNGATVFYRPVFSHISEVTPDSETQAVELDKHLQEYLEMYFSNAAIEEVEADHTPEFTGEFDEDEIREREAIQAEAMGAAF